MILCDASSTKLAVWALAPVDGQPSPVATGANALRLIKSQPRSKRVMDFCISCEVRLNLLQELLALCLPFLKKTILPCTEPLT